MSLDLPRETFRLCWSSLGDRFATVDLDVFDTQSRLVAIAAQRVKDLVDCVVDLLRADRVLVCLHLRLDHRLFGRGIQPRSMQFGHGKASRTCY